MYILIDAMKLTVTRIIVSLVFEISIGIKKIIVRIITYYDILSLNLYIIIAILQKYF